MTVAKLEEELGSGELTEWKVRDKKNPIGRDNWPMAVLACMYRNYHREQGKPAFEVTDFLYGAEDKTKERETSQVIAMFDSVSKKNGPDKT